MLHQIAYSALSQITLIDLVIVTWAVQAEVAVCAALGSLQHGATIERGSQARKDVVTIVGIDRQSVDA